MIIFALSIVLLIATVALHLMADRESRKSREIIEKFKSNQI
jgi:hypothetical protein